MRFPLQVDDSKLSLEEACGLFNPPLEEFELFWEKSLDTKMILAWNKERMVLAFRGTASLANVAADLQASLQSLDGFTSTLSFKSSNR